MSIARQMLREFRPLFRMLEEPLRSPSYMGTLPTRALFDDPFFHLRAPDAYRPAVDVTEDGNSYIVEAELPGVKKENVEVRIGDGGRSVTIEGRTRGDSSAKAGEPSVENPEGKIIFELNDDSSDAHHFTLSASTDVATQTSNQLTSERSFSGDSTFRRTVWLPRPVDPQNVKAKLEDGILSLTIPKAEDKASLKIPVE